MDLYNRLKAIFIMAGPNVIESEEHVMYMARQLRDFLQVIMLNLYSRQVLIKQTVQV